VEVTTEKSLNQSMDSALKHYSSLFFLPSFKKALASVAAVCIGVVGFSTFALFPTSDGLLGSLNLGVSLFAVTLLFDYAVSSLVLRRDPIFVTRRTVALSLYGWVLWLAFIIPGVIFGAAFNIWLWIKLCLLGFCAVLTLRAIVFIASSPAGSLRGILASLLQPIPCIVPFLIFWTRIDSAIPVQVLPFLVMSPFLCFASAFLFVSLIDRVGLREHGIPSMLLFKAFMLNWVVGLNEPIEEFLERMGENEDVEVSFLKFESSKPKAALIVPLVHPGPFKNIGSSLLPSMLKHAFEKAFGGDACVPLGILGHELDLASQKQNQKIIDHVITAARKEASIDKATPFVKVKDGFVTASCQVFGRTALLSFTLAPKTTEDLPQELCRFVREEADKHGLDSAIVVNAHNSINDETRVGESLSTLRDVASKCLEQAAALPSEDFEVGAVTVYPKEFTLKDGMGPGGITAVVVKVGEQKTAYVVIDGNNMISGLREKVLSALVAVGFNEGEVFTTDTHASSAVVLGRRGYHPVGEAMDHATLINHITEAALAAAARLEECKAGSVTLTVPDVRVIGEARIHTLSTLVDEALQRAKQITVPIFAFEGFLLALFLSVL
jgi:putative membrane protein